MTLNNPERQIVLDTETTGMNMDGGIHYLGHKIIEIGAVEIVNRRLTGNHFHVYINPHRMVDEDAYKVHGISNDFLQDKPPFSFVAEKFIQFIDGAELVIHNASFDVGFIDYEFSLINHSFKVAEHCLVTDTLAMARRLFPGKRNNLDVLCERYQIDNSHRTLHGALLDAEILAEVYLAMTGGQTSLSFSNDELTSMQHQTKTEVQKLDRQEYKLNIIQANQQELKEHKSFLEMIIKKSGSALWCKNE
ncbi:MAG: DNA polymerase III subunit epsilon [Candidatus Schmidhempelia sp.]|nr:DNA polymerase III subunit epsilon [Candidatus Schmidhempelia sp.]